MRRRLLPTFMVLLALSACAKDVAPSRPPRPSPVVPSPVAPLAPGPEVQLLEQVRLAHMRLQGFSARLRLVERGPAGTDRASCRVTFRKPSTMKLSIESVEPGTKLLAGTELLLKGETEMKAKLGFMPFALSLSQQDERVRSLNGWSVGAIGLKALFDVLLDPGAQVRFLGETPVEGRPLLMLEIVSRLSPPGATHERIGIDRALALPLARFVHKGERVIFEEVLGTPSLRAPDSASLEI